MGNAARVVAIIEALRGRAKCHVVTWGAGRRFLEEYQRQYPTDFELTTLHDYPPAGSGFRPWRLLRCFAKNSLLLRRLIVRLKPAALLLDSDYHWPAYFGLAQPTVYLGQALDVLERARHTRYRPATWREWWAMLLRERLDAAYQRVFATRILVPCFFGTASSGGRVERIPLLVRREFRAPAARRPVPGRIGVLLSGSHTEREAFCAAAARNQFTVLSLVPSRALHLDECEVVIVQGGLSSISECIARGKFMVVVPIDNHPEQFLNAVEVERLGLGIRSSLYELGRPNLLLERIRGAMERSSRARVDCDGAEASALSLLRLLQIPAEFEGHRHADRRAARALDEPEALSPRPTQVERGVARERDTSMGQLI